MISLHKQAARIEQFPQAIALASSWNIPQEGGVADDISDEARAKYNDAIAHVHHESADYAMKDRTYRYFDGSPLYKFGFGLSYTSFRYSNLLVPASAAADKPVEVSFTVTNTGRRAGDEVSVLYLRADPNGGAPRLIGTQQPMPRLVLAAFWRFHLNIGESQQVKFTLTPQQLLLVNAAGERKLQPGTWQIFAGGGSQNSVLEIMRF